VLVPLAALLAAVLFVAVPVTYSVAALPSLAKSEAGKKVYRKYCGQCHALNEALAAGFGSDKGLGQDGGPSFNNLRVPYNLSIIAVTEIFGGHELVVKKMTWEQLNQVASFVAAATKNHPYLARQSDG
jgi:mono/diheme cytochrome c family protein